MKTAPNEEKKSARALGYSTVISLLLVCKIVYKQYFECKKKTKKNIGRVQEECFHVFDESRIRNEWDTDSQKGHSPHNFEFWHVIATVNLPIQLQVFA